MEFYSEVGIDRMLSTIEFKEFVSVLNRSLKYLERRKQIETVEALEDGRENQSISLCDLCAYSVSPYLFPVGGEVLWDWCLEKASFWIRE